MGFSKKNIVWPPISQEITEDFMGAKVPVYEQMFGSLSNEVGNPLTRVSVANVGFSLDPTKGCPLQCAYCVRLSNKVDGLFDESKPIEEQKVFKIVPEVVIDGEQLVDALVLHPAFIENQSVITIATGSSEAFAPISIEETDKILSTVRNKYELKNPVWIVTKLGIAKPYREEWRKKFKSYTKIGPIVLSVTSSGLPPEIESFQRDRFEFVEDMKDCGVHFSHHLRPIIAGVNDSRKVLKEQLTRSLPLVESVCVGGLRVDPGIKIAWQDVCGLPLDMLPNKPGEKDLPEHVLPMVRELMDEFGYEDMPLFAKSSHVLAHVSGSRDHNLVDYVPSNKSEVGHLLSIPIDLYYEIEKKDNDAIKKLVDSAIDSTGLKLEYKLEFVEDEVLVIFLNADSFYDYRITKVIVHALGHANSRMELLPTDMLNYWKNVK